MTKLKCPICPDYDGFVMSMTQPLGRLHHMNGVVSI